jgi:L-asparaginase
MIEDSTGVLQSFDFQYLKENVPEINRLQFNIDSVQLDTPIDSSDMNPDKWKLLVKLIEENYNQYDGFVILHGTDTMAYTASALSFMLENLNKPVILTGSQLPIGKIRTDGKENLITALEIASDKTDKGEAFAPEVCIFFQNLLLRGNRAVKINADNFSAFHTFNYPVLAEAGTYIRYRHESILHRPYPLQPRFHYQLNPHVTIIRIFPGISAEILRAMIGIPHLKGVVLETFGAGNAPTEKWFLDIIEEGIKKGILIVNVTQCASGSVEMGRYRAGQTLKNIGVLPGNDITTEAAVTKLMFLFGQGLSREDVKRKMELSLAGEMTVVNK